MVELTGKTGPDPTKAVMGEMRAEAAELTREAIDYWFKESQDWLAEAAQQRSDLDSEGRSQREQNGLHAIMQVAVPPSWDEEENQWTFSYPHEGAVFQEFGAKPTEIEAKKAEVLAFEWPDAPEEVQEQFSHTEGDLVFFESIDHPGIPAIGFIRRGRDKTERALESRGTDTTKFGAKGDENS